MNAEIVLKCECGEVLHTNTCDFEQAWKVKQAHRWMAVRGDGPSGAADTYTFVCPSCHSKAWKDATHDGSYG